MSMETFERIEARLELYSKLAEAEVEIAEGAEGVEFMEFASELRKNIHGKVQNKDLSKSSR